MVLSIELKSKYWESPRHVSATSASVDDFWFQQMTIFPAGDFKKSFWANFAKEIPPGISTTTLEPILEIFGSNDEQVGGLWKYINNYRIKAI